MNIKVREFNESDIQAANEIWNEVVEDGVAFPQEECLTEKSGLEFLRVSHIQVLRMMKKRMILSDLHTSSEQCRQMRSYLQCNAW